MSALAVRGSYYKEITIVQVRIPQAKMLHQRTEMYYLFCISLKISTSVTPQITGAKISVTISMEALSVPAVKACIF